MLITFKVKNFLSFDEESVFSMQASKVETHANHVIKGKSRGDVNLLKAGFLYGANASGKSNFIKAIQFAQEIVTKGIKNVNTNHKHFRLNPQNRHKNTQFEFELKTNNKMYAYGFSVSLEKKIVVEEWLVELKKTTEKTIFERKTLENGDAEIEVFAKLDTKTKNRFEVYQQDLNADELFLSIINTKNTKEMKGVRDFLNVFEWIDNEILIITPNIGLDIGNFFVNNNFHYLGKTLNFFMKDIEEVNCTEEEIPENMLERVLQNFSSEMVLQGMNWKNANHFSVRLLNGQNLQILRDEKDNLKIMKKTIQVTKNTKQNLKVNFDISEESDGTRRLIDFLPILSKGFLESEVILIDEIERSLHPELLHKFVEFFLSNTENMQLIATTHATSLLDLSLLRRDEIWFVEKNVFGASNMYSLEEFKPRYDKDIQKNYLNGRFGAIPFIGNPENLGLEENTKKQEENYA